MNSLNKENLLYSLLSGLKLIDSWGDPIEYDFKKWEELLQNIRFINPENKFDYAKYGDYFFDENVLYVITDRLGYSKYNIIHEFTDTEYYQLIGQRSIVIQAKFAGFYIGRKDDFGEKIYYGDILKIDIDNYSKCIDCVFYNGPDKNRIETLSDRGLLGNIFGPVTFHKGWHNCKNPEEAYFIMDQWFGVIPNLCMSKKTEIAANVYFDITINSNENFLGIISKAELTDHTISCGFWDKYVPTSFIENNYRNNRNAIWEYAISEFRKEKTNDNLLINDNKTIANSTLPKALRTWWQKLFGSE